METPNSDIPWPHATTLVLAADTPRQRRWAVSTGIDIVRKLADQRPKVVLADIQLRTPSSLAATLGIEGGQGIVDVLFRGASFSAAAHRPESESFFFLTIGNDPPPRQILYQHPRWQKIATRLAETDAHLLPCVAADDWLESGPIPGFEPCIVLNGTGADIELPEGARRLAEFLAPPEIRQGDEPPVDMPTYAEGGQETEPATDPMLGVSTRPLDRAPIDEPAPADEPELTLDPELASELEPEPEPEAESSWEPEPEPSGEPEPALGQAAPAPGSGFAPLAPLAADETPPGRPQQLVIDDPFVSRGPVVRPRRRRSLVPTVAVTAAAIAVVVLWRTIGSSGSPEQAGALEAAAETTEVAEPGGADPAPPLEATDQTPVETAGVPVETPETPAVDPVAPGSRRQEVSLPYSVAIASYSSFDDAVTRQRDWTRAEVPFYVAPTIVRGVVYYRVFAGILHDRAEAESLMAQLVDEGIKDSVRDWDVRPAGLAFKFGTYPSARDADSVLDTLMAKGVPAYVVAAAGAAGDGSAFHVYAGGYAREEDARPLLEHIERAGLEVELVERVGLQLP